MKSVYLDNNATTRVAPEVLDAMMPYLTLLYGNPSSMHSFGGRMGHDVDQARAQIAQLIGADPDSVYFTAGGSESDNLAIRGALEALDGERRHLVTTTVEHPAVRKLMHYLRDRHGYRLTEIGVNGDGALDLEALQQALDEGDVALVSVMWANNETGVIFPIARIATMVKAAGALLHVDAVQSVGKVPIDLSRVPIDLLAISGHKIHGPKGIGALFVREGVKLAPLIHGGSQEGGLRAGTSNVPGIIGLGAAAELARQQLASGEVEQMAALRDRLERGIRELGVPVRINGRDRLPSTLSVSFEYIEGESVLLLLDDEGIAASSGSACASGSLDPSHVIQAMGIPFTAAHGTIRFSLSRYTTADEIEYTLQRLGPIVTRLREISPYSGEGGEYPLDDVRQVG